MNSTAERIAQFLVALDKVTSKILDSSNVLDIPTNRLFHAECDEAVCQANGLFDDARLFAVLGYIHLNNLLVNNPVAFQQVTKLADYKQLAKRCNLGVLKSILTAITDETVKEDFASLVRPDVNTNDILIFRLQCPS